MPLLLLYEARTRHARARPPTLGVPLLSFEEFAALVERHKGELFGYLRRLVQHREQANDLLQDTFLDAWYAARRGQAPLVPGASQEEMRRWLFRAAYCQAISALRRRLIRWESLDERLATEDAALGSLPSFEDQFVENAALRAGLGQLSPKDASCLLLMVVQGFPAAEVAQIMGDSPQAITKRLSRAKRRLLDAYLAQEASGEHLPS